jgi:hypothetical protein
MARAKITEGKASPTFNSRLGVLEVGESWYVETQDPQYVQQRATTRSRYLKHMQDYQFETKKATCVANLGETWTVVRITRVK